MNGKQMTYKLQLKSTYIKSILFDNKFDVIQVVCGVCVKCIKELRSFQNNKSPDF